MIGKFVDYTMPDFDELFAKSSAYNGRSFSENRAVLSSQSSFIGEYAKTAQLWSTRDYFCYPSTTFDALKGSALLLGDIDQPVSFTVEKAGYVVVITPTVGEKFSQGDKLTAAGFVRFAEDLPHGLGVFAGKMDGNVDYYAKWCVSDESYCFEKWALVLFAPQKEYHSWPWGKKMASVTKLSTPELVAKHADAPRLWQGIPGIEAVPMPGGKTRLYSCFFTGKDREPRVGNFALVYASDDGESWLPVFRIGYGDGESDCRAFDPSLFYDGESLWLWWNQGGEHFQAGSFVCCARVANPDIELGGLSDVEKLEVSEPRITSVGLKMNKPTVLSNGEWLYCCHEFGDMEKTYVFSSLDRGESWHKKSEALVPGAMFANETALAETDDGTVIMWNRTVGKHNVWRSVSHDYGKTWSEAQPNALIGPSSRQNAKRLDSGNILYVHHYNTTVREKLCASLSTDGGKTFPHRLILDPGKEPSYPDITVGASGEIYITWDFNRYKEKQIRYTVLTEQELLACGDGEVLDKKRVRIISQA